mmetsp:Transcript_13444/g.44292  ORF Transcript_13444/g.44292 Transcript_13444/m.44292 type:complete len:175 (+) Transcript_13444:2-526(+)
MACVAGLKVYAAGFGSKAKTKTKTRMPKPPTLKRKETGEIFDVGVRSAGEAGEWKEVGLISIREGCDVSAALREPARAKHLAQAAQACYPTMPKPLAWAYASKTAASAGEAGEETEDAEVAKEEKAWVEVDLFAGLEDGEEQVAANLDTARVSLDGLVKGALRANTNRGPRLGQ